MFWEVAQQNEKGLAVGFVPVELWPRLLASLPSLADYADVPDSLLCAHHLLPGAIFFHPPIFKLLHSVLHNTWLVRLEISSTMTVTYHNSKDCVSTHGFVCAPARGCHGACQNRRPELPGAQADVQLWSTMFHFGCLLLRCAKLPNSYDVGLVDISGALL